MTNVVSLQDFNRDGWTTGKARCTSCRHEWEAVAPAGTDWMECPSCGLHKARLKYPCMPPDDGLVWTCNCGCDALYATPDALRCCGCGAVQKPFD